MKKVFAFLFAMLMISGIVMSQNAPGTLADGQAGTRTGVGLSKYFSITGQYTLSSDGAGDVAPVYDVMVNKPVGATVNRAFLMMASTAGVDEPGLLLLGTPIIWDNIVENNLLIGGVPGHNYWADVTTIVEGTINVAPPGLIPISVEELNSPYQDGVALLVVFDDPAADEKTILILFGSITEGDNIISVNLADLLDPVAPDALMNMGVGISFSEQSSQSQYTRISVQSGINLLTSYAGGEDDGASSLDGSLITVGGIGDLNDNPPNPSLIPPPLGGDSRYDDEYYNLLPLLGSPTTFILLFINNPSYDDNVFLTFLEISGEAFVGESISLSQTVNSRLTNTNHDVLALVQDDGGFPVVSREVFFEVISGPNVGTTGSGFTDSNGNVPFTYLGAGGIGTDRIEACFIDNQSIQQCSNVVNILWYEQTTEVPLSDWALYIGIFLIVAFAVIRFRRMF